jgi:adenylate cyclase
MTGGVGGGPDGSDIAPPTAQASLTDLGGFVADPAELDIEVIATLLLGRPRTLSRTDVSRQAEVSLLPAQRLWHALGFPVVTSNDTVFTVADVDALRRVARLVRAERLDETTALGLARAFARTADRLGAWQVQLFSEMIQAHEGADGDTSRPRLDHRTAQETASAVVELADELEPMLVYAWRRHLTAAVTRMLSDASTDESDLGQRRCIGFADLVSFTSVVQRLSERDLARTVQRFEALASDVVTAHGGRVVKTVGDEVLFATRAAAPAGAIALDLVDALGEDQVLPELRVGVAFGPVVSRLGDVFGTTVNRASRLTAVARPGAVLVDAAMAKALATQSGFDLVPLRRRTMRGVGPVIPHVLSRSGSGTRRGRTE